MNNVICHGIPDEQEILKDGDIINVDVSTILDGYYSDASRMFAIGSLSPRASKLLRVTQECVERGLAQAKPWGHLGDIAYAIWTHAAAATATPLWKRSAAMGSDWNSTKNLLSATLLPREAKWSWFLA